MMRRLLFIFGLVGVLVSRAMAQVTLNFDDLTLTNYDPIPTDYGSLLDTNLAGISYRTFNLNTGVEVSPYLEFWNTDYGDLNKVAFAAQNGNIAEITFTPKPGYAVHLISFDMAGYPHADLSNTTMRLVDASNNVIFDFASSGAVAIQGDANGLQHSTFTPDITYNGTLRLQWGSNWNVGIDNIQFVAVPEASSLGLLGAGLSGLLLLRWYRRRA